MKCEQNTHFSSSEEKRFEGDSGKPGKPWKRCFSFSPQTAPPAPAAFAGRDWGQEPGAPSNTHGEALFGWYPDRPQEVFIRKTRASCFAAQVWSWTPVAK